MTHHRGRGRRRGRWWRGEGIPPARLADPICAAAQTRVDKCACGSELCLLGCAARHPSTKGAAALECLTANCKPEAEVVPPFTDAAVATRTLPDCSTTARPSTCTCAESEAAVACAAGAQEAGAVCAERQERFFSSDFTMDDAGSLFPASWKAAFQSATKGSDLARADPEPFALAAKALVEDVTSDDVVFDRTSEDGTRFRVYRILSVQLRTATAPGAKEAVGAVFSHAGDGVDYEEGSGGGEYENVQEHVAAGLTCAELVDSGYSWAALRSVGFAFTEILDAERLV